MKITLNYLFIAGVLTLSLMSCKKEIPREELLTSGSWKGIAGSTTILGISVDTHAELEDCVKDDLTTFETNKNVKIDEGPLKCESSDPQTYSAGTWSLSENDTKLAFGGVTYDILELSQSRLKIKGSFNELGISGTIELTFGK